MRKVIIASILGALILSLWSSFIWMATPLPSKMMKTPMNPSALSLLMNGMFMESGMYVLPSAPDGNWANPEFQQAYQMGPRIQVFIDKTGGDPKMLREQGLAFLHHLLSVLVVAYMLYSLIDKMQNFSCRFLFSLAIGGVASFQMLLDYIWYPQPLAYHLTMLTVNVIGWALVALLLAKMIKPQTA